LPLLLLKKQKKAQNQQGRFTFFIFLATRIFSTRLDTIFKGYYKNINKGGVFYV